MQGTGPRWAWLQLGLHYLDQSDAGQAITALQHVIRADPNDKYNTISLLFYCITKHDISYHKFALYTVTAGNL